MAAVFRETGASFFLIAKMPLAGICSPGLFWRLRLWTTSTEIMTYLT